MQRTVLELRGIACLPLLTRPKPKQNIASAKSFSHPVESFEALSQAVATYTARAAEKLRSEGSVARSISVFITTNHFNTRVPQYSNTATRNLLRPSAFTPDLMRAALDGLRSIYQQGFQYHKAGVFLSRISRQAHLQFDLFGEVSLERLHQQSRLMETVDLINRLYGSDTIFFGAQGIKRAWQMRQAKRSPRYTTRWQELFEVHAQ